jgi:hypothetical protein
MAPFVGRNSTFSTGVRRLVQLVSNELPSPPAAPAQLLRNDRSRADVLGSSATDFANKAGSRYRLTPVPTSTSNRRICLGKPHVRASDLCSARSVGDVWLPVCIKCADRCSHSITSLARAMTMRGTDKPSASAVLRLTTKSTLAGAWTGRSAGLLPLRMRSTYPEVRR